ncbi:hypothetical protein [Sulfurospirillum barnesii]|uniref:Uncharacterized protein n=1 Tax=Sulfurospirillum barnesii (strain ATCC 700032 / DSM 10660 / SES-3) TaxID=760154 RepID=I3XUK2_SULBS|nr:hypothetical protein [Sulfurospirillum barnesii]AFL67626.1 hypothetical protein Sulba_0300 [Sulfurospirillum barnesii SES-3]
MKVLISKVLVGFLVMQGLLHAQVIPLDKSVVVMPLRYTYQVSREFYDEYSRAESSLKGYAHEKGSVSHNAQYREGYSGGSASASSKGSFDGKYDLKAKDEREFHASTDKVIVEKSFDSEKLTGIIESALSEGGVKLGMRNPEYAKAKTSEEAAKKAISKRAGDYVLTGDIVRMQLGGIRRVPDGTERRYAINATCKISIKITRASDSTSTFARTFTGKGSKTFDASEYIPTDEVIDMAVEDVALQITAALLGKRIANPSESDDEYQDSPGKRLVQ